MTSHNLTGKKVLTQHKAKTYNGKCSAKSLQTTAPHSLEDGRNLPWDHVLPLRGLPGQPQRAKFQKKATSLKATL